MKRKQKTPYIIHISPAPWRTMGLMQHVSYSYKEYTLYRYQKAYHMPLWKKLNYKWDSILWYGFIILFNIRYYKHVARKVYHAAIQKIHTKKTIDM